MSGSVMFSAVAFDPTLILLGAAVIGGLALARRNREQGRCDQRAALAAERSRQAELRRQQLRAELEERRRAELAARAARTRAEHGRAELRRLDEADALLAEVLAEVRDARTAGAGPPGADPVAELLAIGSSLADLRDRTGGPEPLGPAIEELRGRIVVLRPAGSGRPGSAKRSRLLHDLELRFMTAGLPDPPADEAGRTEVGALLDRLRAAATAGREVRFEALLGTVEHALARHETAVAGAVDARERRDAERLAHEAAERERSEALWAALAEAGDRFAVVSQGAADAAQDAAELGDPELAGRLEAALGAVTDALALRLADHALTAVAALEVLLPEAEERLDELQLAYSRRGELAQALKEAMTGAGLSFTGGAEQEGRLVLSFERPSGAVYEASVGPGADGLPLLTYRVAGEADMSVREGGQGAVCTPEELLDRVHAALNEDGFLPGELTWDGRPPRGAAAVPPHQSKGRHL
ncbi:hypothetical protein ACWCQL_16270 [Streptomyces sp. NPDC002073]